MLTERDDGEHGSVQYLRRLRSGTKAQRYMTLALIHNQVHSRF